jgi:outer membrane immunogenic protein
VVCRTDDVLGPEVRDKTKVLPNGLDRLFFFWQKRAMKQLIRLTILLCSCAALALTVVAGPEPLPSGKEMKQVAPAPPPECDFNWTGFYIGGNVGYAWGNADTDIDPLPDVPTFLFLEPTTLNPDPSGFIGGGQIGYNWQWNKWLVLGVEADFQGSDMEGDDTVSPVISPTGLPSPIVTDSFLKAHERMQWFGTVRGRVGFVPWCRLLIYGTGGFAYGNVDYSGEAFFVDTSAPAPGIETHTSSRVETNTGWTAGGGIEYAIGHHWTVRAEYLYYDLGDQSDSVIETLNGHLNPPFGIHYRWETSGNIVRGGFNFKF